jgi:hypothetical protein
VKEVVGGRVVTESILDEVWSEVVEAAFELLGGVVTLDCGADVVDAGVELGVDDGVVVVVGGSEVVLGAVVELC